MGVFRTPLSARTKSRKGSSPPEAEDLKDLGVFIVGRRRVLLDAIADLRSPKDTEQTLAAVETAAPPAKRPPPSAAKSP